MSPRTRPDRPDSVSQLAEQVSELQELLRTVLMIKEPGATQAADAYEGLRRAVIGARQARTQHEVHLARIDAALQKGVSKDDMSLLLRDLLADLDVRRVDELAGLSAEQLEAWFEVVGTGTTMRVEDAAYIGPTQVISRGRVRAHDEQGESR